MKRILMTGAALIAIVTLPSPSRAGDKPGASGEALFREHCSACHPGGGNIINSAKTLRKADREAHYIMTREDIVDKMRHPGKGMTSWSAATLPDEDAAAIADYIIRTFK